MAEHLFHFREFSVRQAMSPARIGTDGVLLGAWVHLQGAKRLLDVGTGTGVIALMLAQRFPEASVEALEIHPDAIREAQYNFEASPWATRLTLHSESATEFQSEFLFDVIVSNPPYFKGGTASPDQDRRSWRTQQSLHAVSMAELAKRVLSPQGRWAVVVPLDTDQDWKAAAQAGHFHLHRETRVIHRQGKAARRVLLEFGRRPQPLEQRELTLQIGGLKEYSEEAQALLRPFYPWMT